MPDDIPSTSSGSTTPEQTRPPAAAAPLARRWRRSALRWVKRLGITLLALVILAGTLLAVAEHRTSKPEFCGSCHIMEPYYATWHADPHGGKLEVACVECHYAPGERSTVQAKLRGLSQVASYVSGRYGTSRPRAHVDNQSCTTSKCHGDLAFMDKVITIGTVHFVHAKHLQFEDEKLAATQRELDQLTAVLRPALGDQRFQEFDTVAHQVIPVKEQVQQLTALVNNWQAKVEAAQLTKYSELLHRHIRLNQLRDLQCTNCHSYGAPAPSARDDKGSGRREGQARAHHFTVKTTSCYTCHFNNQSFNAGTGTCLLCHTLPTKEITVHKELSPAESAKLSTPDLSKPPVRMDHRAILERKVECIRCHADVAADNALVTRRDCERCHDRPGYFQDWKEPFTLNLVERYHALHIPEQRAKCLDCHSEIHHQLVPARAAEGKGQTGFLSSVMAECRSCHPNQHQEQIKLLSGAGGVGVPKSDPNLMFGSRTNCLGCHTEHTTTMRGNEVVRGGVSGCIACHGDRHTQTFEKWKKGLEVMQADANEAYEKARQLLDKTKALSPETRAKAVDLVRGARADLELVKRGNGIHNVTYAMELLDSVSQRCQQAMSLISKDNRGKGSP